MDINKIKKEIDYRKKHKEELSITPDDIKYAKVPKYGFLNELVTSLKMGKPTNATEKVMSIEQNAEKKIIERNGGVYNEPETKKIQKQPLVETPRQKSGTVTEELNRYSHLASPELKNEFGERDDELYREFERKRAEYQNGGVVNYKQQNPHPQKSASYGQINEEILDKHINEKLNNNFIHIVEQALKDQIVDIYAKSRMKETISENRDEIKKIVYEVIRELQKESKEKKMNK